ncbi:MAG: hypothetical protein PHX61_10395 [Alphaproteobacteria bacterium]|nr:hypothetical protein [Alphaproteobacteria bacterium]
MKSAFNKLNDERFTPKSTETIISSEGTGSCLDKRPTPPVKSPGV